MHKSLHLTPPIPSRNNSILHVQKNVVACLNIFQLLQELFKQFFLCTKIYAQLEVFDTGGFVVGCGGMPVLAVYEGICRREC